VAVFMENPNGDGWAHLLSDLNGKEGREELVSFGRRIGLRRRIHRKGSYAEHYDIRKPEIELAKAAGARIITRRGLASILREKKRESA
jgi:hypothetical protein